MTKCVCWPAVITLVAAVRLQDSLTGRQTVCVWQSVCVRFKSSNSSAKGAITSLVQIQWLPAHQCTIFLLKALIKHRRLLRFWLLGLQWCYHWDRCDMTKIHKFIHSQSCLLLCNYILPSSISMVTNLARLWQSTKNRHGKGFLSRSLVGQCAPYY